jgi:hypothetical protein
MFIIALLAVTRRIKIEPVTNLIKKGYRFLLVLVGPILVSMLLALFAGAIVGYIGLLVAILPFLLAPFAAVHYSQVLKRFTNYTKYITALSILAMLGSLLLISGVPLSRVVTASTNSDLSAQVLEQLKVDQNQVQYRLGVRGTEGWIGEWWNYRTQVPETRESEFERSKLSSSAENS